jgi:hypothetical protein
MKCGAGARNTRFNFDLKAIFDDLRRGTEEAGQAGHTVVILQ